MADSVGRHQRNIPPLESTLPSSNLFILIALVHPRMSPIEFECERCIVSILINGKIMGTGFVIGPGKVLTCAHVVNYHEVALDEEFLGNQFEVEFYADICQQSQGKAGMRQAVQLHTEHYSRKSENDIALLTWEGELPVGVRPARFSFDSNLSDRPIRSRGFPTVEDYGSQAGTGEIVGPIRHSKTGALHWTLRSQEIDQGFSGAPIFDKSSWQVVAMARAIFPVDENWRNMGTAVGISVQTLQEVCGELIRASGRSSTFEFATDYLNANTVALQVFRELVAPGSPAPLTADAIVEKTLKETKPLDAILNYLEDDAKLSNGVLKTGLSDEQCDAIWQICDYATCLVLPQKQVDILNEQLAGRKLSANTLDRRLIVIHLAASFNLAKFDSRAATESDQTISQRRQQGLIATEDHAILSMHGNSDEAGAGSDRSLNSTRRNTSSEYSEYQQAFIRGMACQCHLSNAVSEGINYLLVQINDRLTEKRGGKDTGPVVAVFMTDWRDSEIDALKGLIPGVYFVQLPLESDREYAIIALRREDIFKLIDDHRRK